MQLPALLRGASDAGVFRVWIGDNLARAWRAHGYTALTSQELLLLVQAEKEHRAERGFAIGPDWSEGFLGLGTGHPWPNRTVKFVFSTNLDDEDVDWMLEAMGRMEAGTGMRFTRVANNTRHWFRWNTFIADFVKIEKRNLRTAGLATVGKTLQSYLTMDRDYVRDEYTFNHEMGHVFGLLHEHQRHDRDRKVRVGESGSGYNKLSRTRRSCFLWVFDCRTVTNTTHYGTPYDYNSVMHYGSCEMPVDITLKNGKYWVVFWWNKDRWGDENEIPTLRPGTSTRSRSSTGFRQTANRAILRHRVPSMSRETTVLTKEDND